MIEVLVLIVIVVLDLCSKNSILRGKDPNKYGGPPWTRKKKS